MKLKSIFISMFLLLSASCKMEVQDALEVKKGNSVYQSGADQNALWAYIGFVPRVSSADNLKITISKRGFTLRAHAKFSQEEVANYAEYIVTKARQMEEVRTGTRAISWADGTYATPFQVMEQDHYKDFIKEVNKNFAPVVGKGFEKNLKLLKKYFKENVAQVGNEVHLHLVYPVATGKGEMSNPLQNLAWLQNSPHAGSYKVHSFEERRTYYSVEKTHIFGGFPALWFNGQIGMHGPITWTTNPELLKGKYDEVKVGNKPVSKRWQLVRTADSHNCIRMEHVHELRHLMPSEDYPGNRQSEAQTVRIDVTNDFDYLNLGGKKTVVGVKYYWVRANELPDEKRWKALHYQTKIPSLYEYEYRVPGLVQLSAGKADATAAHLNRLPLD